VLGAYHRLQFGDGLLHGIELEVGGGAELAALFDLVLGALEFGGVAAEQAVEFALEANSSIFGLGGVGGIKAHHRGKIVSARGACAVHAEQGQGVDLPGLKRNAVQFALDVAGQFTAPAAHQFVPGQGQLGQVLRGAEQQGQVGAGLVGRGVAGVLAQLFQAGTQLALGLQQQGLGVAGQFAGGQQFGIAVGAQVFQAGAQRIGQCGRQRA